MEVSIIQESQVLSRVEHILQILEARGFAVYLVNAAHIKNVPGKKTDILDCQWIQQLHTYGLLQASQDGSA